MNADIDHALTQARIAYGQRRFLVMPIAGTIAWAVIATASFFVPHGWMYWVVFIATGSIFGMGVLLGKLMGDPLIGPEAGKTEMDNLFLTTVVMANLVWAIAIPFFLVMPDSLPLTVGILTGLMWIPFSWMIRHWVGYFHAIARTALIVLAWYWFPDDRFLVIPLIVVAIYLVTIAVLAKRKPAAV